MPTRDEVKDLPVDVLLGLCLDANGRNRMAFEYLMGYLLLNGRLEEAIANIGRLSDLGYAAIPRSYEEAILLYESRTRKHVDLQGRAISSETRERFRGFYEALSSFHGDTAAARRAMAKDYGDTYFYYWTFTPAGGRP